MKLNLKIKVMSKVYYDETLKNGESVLVTDSYVKYTNGKIVDQIIPLKSIDNVTVGANNNTRYEIWRAVSCILVTVCLILRVIGFMVGSISLLLVSFGIVFAPIFDARYAIFIRTSSGYDICIKRKSFKDKENDPKLLMGAIAKAMEENNTVMQ